jgi:hypothetical protein
MCEAGLSGGRIGEVAAGGEIRGFEQDFLVLETRMEGREVGIAVVFLVDVADDPFRQPGFESGVDFRASDDVDGAVEAGELGEVGGVVDGFDAGPGPIAIPGEDDVAATWQGAAYGFVGSASHDDRMAGGALFEKGQVGREVPGQGAVFTDDAGGCHGDDGDEAQVLPGGGGDGGSRGGGGFHGWEGEGAAGGDQTATGALMAGWDW